MMRQYGSGDPCLHDPYVIAYLIEPSLFEGRSARLSVDCASPLTIGRTVAAVSERHRKGEPTNCEVMTRVDDEGLFQLLSARISRLN
jgi:purine nucleosidase